MCVSLDFLLAFSLISREAKRRATQFEAILAKFQYDISVLDLFREEKDVCILLYLGTLYVYLVIFIGPPPKQFMVL